jgi:hypothetical protein
MNGMRGMVEGEPVDGGSWKHEAEFNEALLTVLWQIGHLGELPNRDGVVGDGGVLWRGEMIMMNHTEEPLLAFQQ